MPVKADPKYDRNDKTAMQMGTFTAPLYNPNGDKFIQREVDARAQGGSFLGCAGRSGVAGSGPVTTALFGFPPTAKGQAGEHFLPFNVGTKEAPRIYDTRSKFYNVTKNGNTFDIKNPPDKHFRAANGGFMCSDASKTDEFADGIRTMQYREQLKGESDFELKLIRKAGLVAGEGVCEGVLPMERSGGGNSSLRVGDMVDPPLAPQRAMRRKFMTSNSRIGSRTETGRYNPALEKWFPKNNACGAFLKNIPGTGLNQPGIDRL